ncbi:hypothetical protein NB694_004181 [Pantoea ananatis]|nr:hypothetical protein [Pantoea ananatis]
MGFLVAISAVLIIAGAVEIDIVACFQSNISVRCNICSLTGNVLTSGETQITAAVNLTSSSSN